MLTEICGYLRNWFHDRKLYGNFKIDNGSITFANGDNLPLEDGQYYRIIGSLFNDGVYRKISEGSSEDASGESDLKNEEFDGSVWTMKVPPEFLKLAKEIEDWQAKYGGIDSQAMSPFNSESFGGYSYTKASGNSSDGTNAGSWQDAFANRLNRYRKF